MIIQSTKNKVKNAESLINELGEFELEIEQNEKKAVELKKKLAVTEREVSDLSESIEIKEKQIEALKDKDIKLSGELGEELTKFKEEKRKWESQLQSDRSSIEHLESKLINDHQSLEKEKKEWLDKIQQREKVCADREKDLDLLSAHLEEYKNRLLIMGVKRGVSFNE